MENHFFFENNISQIDKDIQNDDLFFNNSTLIFASTENFFNSSDVIDETNFIPKLFELEPFDQNIEKLNFLDSNNSICDDQPSTTRKIFLISKIHSFRCHHLSDINKNHRKNKIKNVLKKDFSELFKKSTFKLNPVNLDYKKNLKGIETRPKNRNFRLFDNDVMIKKLICHFFKFLSNLIQFIESTFDINLQFDSIINNKKYTQQAFLSILNSKLKPNNIKIHNKRLDEILSLTVKNVYFHIFLRSYYFKEITDSFKLKFGELYTNCFVKIANEIDFFFKTSKKASKDKHVEV